MLPYHSPDKSSEPTAFSLVELLVVMGIIALIVAAGIPAVRSITASRGVSQAANELAAACETARLTALGQRTFVWVGVQNRDDTATYGVHIGIAASKDGSASPTPTNQLPIGRASLVRGVRLTPYNTLPTEIRDNWTGKSEVTADLAAGTASGVELKVGAALFTDKRTLTFTPSGEVLLIGTPSATDKFDKAIGIGLAPRAGQETEVALVVDGATGLGRIVQHNP